MAKIELKEMTLTDFKGQPEKKVVFGHRTIVSGQNGCGKTTLADAFMWVFCDKDYSLRSNPDVRPDDGRECLPRVDLKLIIDGKPVSVSKYQKRSKSKNGTVSLSNEFVVNDVKMGKEKFQNALKEREFDFENFLTLAHMDVFTSAKDKDARTALLSMPCGEEETDLSIARTIPECKDIVTKMEAEAKTVAEIEAGAKTDLKKAEERIKAIPSEIKGKEELKVDVDTAELELQKNALQEEITGIKEQISKTGNERAGEIKTELASLRVKKNGIEADAKTELLDHRMAVQSRISVLQADRNITSSSLNAKTLELETLSENKKGILKTLQDSRTEYPKIKDSEWDDSELKKIEAETFDEADTICPTCRQTLPAEKIEQLKVNFEQKKQERINQQLKAKEKWEQDKKRRLDEIVQTGNQASADMKEAHKKEETLASEITGLTERLEQIKNSLEEKNKELEAIPAELDLSQNAEYQKTLADIKVKEHELASLDDGEEAKKQLAEQLKAKKDELAAVNQKIGEANNNVRIDEQIEKLEVSRKEYSQKKADAQMILDELKSLSMAKNTALEDAVNQYFDGVKVKLFDTQKNGEVVDACIWYVQDKDGNWKKLIGNANTALMMKGKIAIMDGLQKFYGVSYPIFVDCAAELDNSSLAGIKADAQLIFLKVAEGNMTVTEI